MCPPAPGVRRQFVLLWLGLALLALFGFGGVPSARVVADQPRSHRIYLPVVSRVAATVTPALSPQQQAMAAAINSARTTRGLPPLQLAPALFTAAQGHSEVMAAAACFAHQCTGEAPLGERITAAGYGWADCAETIAGASYEDAEAMVALWLGSDAHRAILLDPTLRDLGIGYAGSWLNGWHYWTADLAVPAG